MYLQEANAEPLSLIDTSDDLDTIDGEEVVFVVDENAPVDFYDFLRVAQVYQTEYSIRQAGRVQCFELG